MKKIMFSDKHGLTKAVIEGSKTETRRIITYPIKCQGQNVVGFYVYRKPSGEVTKVCMYDENERFIDGGQLFPRYKVGEVIAIAQSYKDCRYDMELIIDGKLMYKHPGWNNKMFVKPELMPYAIKITDVRVERLQDISNEDCLKEGIKKHISHAKVYYTHDGIGNYFFDTPRDAFASLIDRVSGKGTWESNPFVWVYGFEVIKSPRGIHIASN